MAGTSPPSVEEATAKLIPYINRVTLLPPRRPESADRWNKPPFQAGDRPEFLALFLI